MMDNTSEVSVFFVELPNLVDGVDFITILSAAESEELLKVSDAKFQMQRPGAAPKKKTLKRALTEAPVDSVGLSSSSSSSSSSSCSSAEPRAKRQRVADSAPENSMASSLVPPVSAGNGLSAVAMGKQVHSAQPMAARTSISGGSLFGPNAARPLQETNDWTDSLGSMLTTPAGAGSSDSLGSVFTSVEQSTDPTAASSSSSSSSSRNTRGSDENNIHVNSTGLFGGPVKLNFPISIDKWSEQEAKADRPKAK